ncbi:MAG: tetratricopeptide repeat protein [Desulfobacterales bacterium]|nr:tetratricopeptide repeat protein [Desulfobacterales bacterium]
MIFRIYCPSINGPYILDDLQNIKGNPHIRLQKISVQGLLDAGFKSHSSNRPIANISFALNYYFHRYSLAGYHLVNVLIHLITGILLYFLLNETWCLAEGEKSAWTVPFFAALLWTVHPLHTESVSYIVQRMNSMASMFYVLSMLFYIWARQQNNKKKRAVFFAGCFFAGLLALGSKETAATLPFFILLSEFYFFQNLSIKWLKHQIFPLLGGAAFLIILVFLYMKSDPWKIILSGYEGVTFSMTERLLTEPRVIWGYVSLLLWPHPSRLNFCWSPVISKSFFSPWTTLPAILMLAGMMGLAVNFAIKKHKLFSFCILWFLGNLILESSVLPLQLMFEHRTYLPSMFLSLAAVLSVFRAAKYWKIHPQAVTGGLIIAVIFLSAWTYQRNTVWSSDIVLWSDCLKKLPSRLLQPGTWGGAWVCNNLGEALAKNKQYKKAFDYFFQAFSLKPGSNVCYNIGLTFLKTGERNKAHEYFQKALSFDSDYAKAHNSIGALLLDENRTEDAFAHFSEALRINPYFSEAWNNMGNYRGKTGSLEKAIQCYSEAIRFDPEFFEASFNLALNLARAGREKDAFEQVQDALRIRPQNHGAKKLLKMIQQQLNKNLNSKPVIPGKVGKPLHGFPGFNPESRV